MPPSLSGDVNHIHRHARATTPSAAQLAASVCPPASRRAPVTALCWSQNGRYLVSGSKDGQVFFWNVLEGDHVSPPGVIDWVIALTRAVWRKLWAAQAQLVMLSTVESMPLPSGGMVWHAWYGMHGLS